MSSRPSSRATAGEDGMTSLRSSTAKRPLTKPVAPRLSASNSATKPTSTSSAHVPTTPSSSLSKPPARPTTTTSTAKRPLSSTATTASSLHRVRPSSASVEASGDESKRDGITAKPKRISLASTASSERPTTISSRAATATPVRKPALSTTGSTVRPNVRSPTSTSKSAVSSTARPTSTLGSRTRPVSSSTARTATTLADRKRLSTIPSSPAVKKSVEEADENKENEVKSAHDKLPIRPVLGTRKSTRSVLIEQRIHEFELVNQMLHSSMTADGMDSEEEKHIQQESKKTMAKLRSDLAKIRHFEKEHGRLPTEVELAEVDDVAEEEEKDELETRGNSDNQADDSEIAAMKEDLEESRGQVQELKSHLAEMTARMEYFGRSAEEESEKVQEAVENIRSEHAAKIEEMIALHNSQINELQASHQAELDATSGKYHAELESLRELSEKDISEKHAEIEALRTELSKDTKDTSDTVADPVPAQDAASDNSELEEVKAQLKATRDRHSAAKDNAKLKMARILDEYTKGMKELKVQHAEKIAEMQNQLDKIQGASIQDEEIAKEKEAHAETLRMLQDVRNELDAIKKSRDSEAETHVTTMKDLEEQLAALQKSNMDDANDREQSTSKLKADHEEQIQSLQGQLQATHAELQKSTDASDKQDSEALQKIKDELKAVQDQLTSTTLTHDNLAKRLEAQARTAKAEAESAVLNHRKNLEALQMQLDIATSSFGSKDKERTEQLESLQTQLASKDEEVKILKQEHDAKLSKVQADTDSAHQKALERLKNTHAGQLRMLEEQSNSVLRDLESLEAANAANEGQIKANASAAQQTALEAQASSYKTVVSELEEKLASVQSDVADIKELYEQKLSKMNSDHAQDKDTALAKLASHHEQKLAENKSQSKISEDALDTLKASHAEELQKHESKVKVTASEVDTAKFQVQTLKGILQSMEQEHQEKEEEYQKELEKKDSDFSQAIVKLSSQSKRIAELETAHKQAVEQAKAAVEAETQASLNALKQQHDETFANLRTDLETAHYTTLQTLRSEHSSAIRSLTEEVDSRDYDIETMKTEHAQALSDLHAHSQRGNTDALEKLKVEHTMALNDATSSLQTKHDAHIKEMQDEHSIKSAQLAKTHSESLERTEAEHENVVRTLRSDLEKVREKLQDTSEVDAMSAKLSASQQAFGRLQEEQVETLSNMSKEHANEINRLQVELQILLEETRKPIDTAELDGVKAELAEAKGKIGDLTASHAEAVGNKDLEHAAAIEELQTELKRAKAAALSTESSKEAEEVKSLLEDAKRTIIDLSEQYEAATMDAENQRLAAESAKKELTNLKKSLGGAQVLPESLSDLKQPATKPTNGGTSSSKSSPKAGLKASKWASTEPDPLASSDSTASEKAAKQQASGLALSSGTTESITAQQKSTVPKERNVAGQMAGIQEHIRQLTEMNDEFLLDHQKWARSLSRVEDDGTVTMTEPLEGVEEEREEMRKEAEMK